MCKKCPYDCFTCDSNGNCQSCNATTDFRELNSTTKRCVAVQGYFDAKVTVASKCNQSCILCTALTNCSLCQDSYFLTPEKLCASFCPARYYADVPTKTCKQCLYDCYTCASDKACLSCNETTDFRTFDKATSRCVPIAGYYESVVRVSAKCSISNCRKCLSPTHCTLCAKDFVLLSNFTCGVGCPNGTYADEQTSKCTACPTKCLTCSSATICTSCVSGAYFGLDKMCYFGCPLRSFPDDNTKLCLNCSYYCYTCQYLGRCLSCNSTSDFRAMNSSTGRCDPIDGYY